MMDYSVTTTPRYVTCTNHDTIDGNMKEYTWDQKFISVDEDSLDDMLMLQNVFEGKIVSSKIYPLVYDTKGPSAEISCRSLEFYKEVDQDNTLYQQLSSEKKHLFLIGVRDLFIASCRHMLSEEENNLLKRITELIDPTDNDPDIVSKEILNMTVTPYPTRSHKMVRFFEYNPEAITTLSDECFIKNELNMRVGFVDPCELSYHNFENIINLDSLFDENFDRFKITNFQQLPGSDVFTFDMLTLPDTLRSLDQYHLYVQPLNKLSRGGQRFIFSSKILSDNLTTCVKTYMKDTNIVNDKFRFVNWVFRYNKFKPGDKKFVCHYDTPYHDASQKHHSKYTVLLYLTPGTADPVLSFDNGKVRIDSIDLINKQQIKGVIFDQRYDHEGKAFVDTDKIFIRSELIYEYSDDEYTSDNEVAKKFNQACYMTKQSLFNSEVEKFASDAFNQAAEARVSMAKNFQTNDVLVYKKFEKTPFVTNGYDYWFKNDLHVRDAAIITLYDFFNCKLESGQFFNKLTSQEVIKLDLDNTDDIFKYLTKDNSCNTKNEHERPNFDDEEDKECQEEIKKKTKTVILCDNNQKNSAADLIEIEVEDSPKKLNQEEISNSEYSESKNEGDENCCPFHSDDFKPESNRSLRNHLKRKKRIECEILQEINENNVMYILDKKIELRSEDIIITDTAIIFKNRIPGFYFAANYCDYCGGIVDNEEFVNCWYKKNKDDYFNIEKKEGVAYKCLLSIPYVTSEYGHHLKLDVFHNDIIRSEKFEVTRYSLITE